MATNSLVCNVCFHHCRLEPGQTGRCSTRANIDGENVSLNYGKATSLSLDPIEKKPLANFYPGTNILSVGSFGCNLTCPFCQNYTISMSDGSDGRHSDITPEELVAKALDLLPYRNIGIAFTYNEPLLSHEYVLDTSILAHQYGLKTVAITNGSINPEIFRNLAKHIDAFNIDLKGLSLYDKISGDLETVKQNIKAAVEEGSHVEVTTLVIPGENDSREEIAEIAKFLAEIDPNITYHVTRFFPNYKMRDKPPTPVSKIYELAGVAKEYLKNVEVGNV